MLSRGAVRAGSGRMQDVFITYAKADRAFAERLERALGAEGFSIWRWPETPPDSPAPEAPPPALEASRCVVAVWSPTALESARVHAEALRAAEAGKLYGVSRGDVARPRALAHRLHVPLEERDSFRDIAEFQRLTRALRRRVDRTRRALTRIAAVAAALAVAVAGLAAALTAQPRWERDARDGAPFSPGCLYRFETVAGQVVHIDRLEADRASANTSLTGLGGPRETYVVDDDEKSVLKRFRGAAPAEPPRLPGALWRYCP